MVSQGANESLIHFCTYRTCIPIKEIKNGHSGRLTINRKERIRFQGMLQKDHVDK